MSTKIFLTYHYAKGKIIAKTDEFKIEENESSLTSEDKEDNYEKFNSEKDKLKKKLFLQKSDLINSFLKIEDDFFNSVIETLDYNKKIDDNRQITDGNQSLFKSGILEKNIFDQDMSSVNNFLFYFMFLCFYYKNYYLNFVIFLIISIFLFLTYYYRTNSRKIKADKNTMLENKDLIELNFSYNWKTKKWIQKKCILRKSKKKLSKFSKMKKWTLQIFYKKNLKSKLCF